MKNLICIGFLFLTFTGFGQFEFYSCGQDGELVQASVNDCQSRNLGTFGMFTDIAITPSGTIYATGGSDLFRLDTVNDLSVPLGQIAGQNPAFYGGLGLTALDDENLLIDNSDSLYLYNLTSSTAEPLGKIGHICKGDFALHLGTLYMVSVSNHLMRITLDPISHQITQVTDIGYMNTSFGNVFSLFSVFESCGSGSKQLCVIDNKAIFRVDPETAAVEYICEFGNEHLSLGATSLYDFPISNPGAVFTVPNVFTPNGDNINDTFTIESFTFFSAFTIVNRWGEIVYEHTGNGISWDGTDQKGAAVVPGVYFYTGSVDGCGKSGHVNGFISVSR